LDNGVNVRVYNSTADSIADLHFTLATTARPRDMVKDVYTATSAMEATHAKIAKGQNIGVMFGAERTGLENQDVALASAIVTIPLNPDFSSLNLAQATLLIAYEFMIQADATAPIQTNIGKTDIANDGATSQFTERLIDSLNDKNFFKSPDLRPTMERNLTNMIARHQWTAQEIQTLQGILSALARN
jgi:tRNA/rRNA methyltransferase